MGDTVVCCLTCGNPHIAYVYQEFKSRVAKLTPGANVNRPNSLITSADVGETDEIRKIYDDLGIDAMCCKISISAVYKPPY